MIRVLALNAGSSTLKYGFFEATPENAKELVRDTVGVESLDAPARAAAVAEVLRRLRARGLEPQGIGHRVVFGGPRHLAHEIITRSVVEDLRAEVIYDPLHLPLALDVIEAAAAAYPGIAQAACYDTAFHSTLPMLARRFALPRELYPTIRRYGFHGLSYEYVVSQLGERAKGRVVIAHLGNGASLAALLDGRSIDTTMGLTVLGGIMMGTRSGDLDPGVVLRLFQEGRSLEQVTDLLTNRSGLFGVSGETEDVRDLITRSTTDIPAAEALALFAYIAKKAIGALAAVLGGLDRLVFTGGIGEHATEVRNEILSGLDYLAATVEVIPTDEDAMIARHTAALIQGKRPHDGIE
jgi:acetate kinase